MSAADAPKTSRQVGSPAEKDAGEWAKAVVDGMPEKPGKPIPPPAPLGNVTPDGTAAPTDAPTDEGVEVGAESGEAAPPEVADDDADNTDNADNTGDSDNTGTPLEDREAISVEDLVIDLERVTTERDQYLDASRRLQAEFENYKKQVGKREVEARERANDSLISELLPVLDAFDGAVASGAEDVVPMRTSFLDTLGKQGLERIDPGEDNFDPTLHEAVMHEDADDVEGPVVAEVMRAGYVWKGRVLRPAMVRTRG